MSIEIRKSGGSGSTTISGNVTVIQPTHDNLNANANVQVGNVDVSNSNPVPVSDAGESITVDGTVTANRETTSTATHSNVSGSATSVTVLDSNSNRRGATVFNDSTAILYLKLGATASTTSFTVKMHENDYYEVPFGYAGIIDGIWSGAIGAARVVEFTA